MHRSCRFNRFPHAVLIAMLWFAPAMLTGQEKLQIAVADLQRRSDDVSLEQARMISELLRDEIVRTRAVEVIERQRMDDLLAEHEFQLSGLVDEAAILKIGTILPVSSLLVGSVGTLFERLVVTVRLVDVKTAETLLAQNLYSDTEDLFLDIRLLAAEVGLSALSLAKDVSLKDVQASMKRRDYRGARRLLDAYLQRTQGLTQELEALNAELNSRLARANFSDAQRALRKERFSEARELVNEAMAVEKDEKYEALRKKIDEAEQLVLAQQEEQLKLKALRDEARARRAAGTESLADRILAMSVNGFHLAAAAGVALNEQFRIAEVPAWYGGEIFGTREILKPPNEGRAGFNHIAYSGLNLRYRDVDGSGSFIIAPYFSPGLAWGLKLANIVINLGLDVGGVLWFGGFVAEGYLPGISGGGLFSVEIKVSKRGGIFAATRIDYLYFPTDPGRTFWEPRLIAGLVF